MYPSTKRRISHLICQPCIVGKHSACPSSECPCLCNDEDARFPSKTASDQGPPMLVEAIDERDRALSA